MAKPPVTTLSASQEVMFQKCLKTGMLNTYAAVMREINPSRPPKDMVASMRQFIAYMGPIRVDDKIARRCYRDFGLQVSFYTHFGVLLVLSEDERPLAFIPRRSSSKDLRVDRTPVPRSPSQRLFSAAMTTQDPRCFRGARSKQDFNLGKG